jgi:hypothetical protein
LSLAIGASVAVASRTTLMTERLMRSAALWALVALQALVVLPFAAYLFKRYPDWSLMYLFDGASLPQPLQLTILSSLPVTAVGSFILARRFVMTQRWQVALTMAGAGLMLVGLIVYLGRDSLGVVGTTSMVRGGTGRPISDTSLIYLLVMGVLAVVASWAATLWRLWLVSQAAERQKHDHDTVKAAPRGSAHGAKTQPPRKTPRGKS